jgi:hypothetical protein
LALIAGPFFNVLFLPELQINLFSQKQAMHEGASITLSADAAIFTVRTRIPPGGVFCFSFDGTFWIYDEAAAALRALVSTN